MSFERRLALALVLFSLIPSAILLGGGALLLTRSVEVNTSSAAWEQVANSARPLLTRAESSGEPALIEAAERHRDVLASSLVQAGRWEYLNQRVIGMIPFAVLALALIFGALAIYIARSIARELAHPIQELAGWSERIARDEPLPPADPTDPVERGEFAVLRGALRRMADELALSRERALEAERSRTWIAVARGVAHELKNSLTPLRLGVRALDRQLNGDEAIREPLEVIEAESQRLEELARSFAQFGQLPEGPVSEIDLAEQVNYLLRTHLPPQVTGRLRSPVGLPRVLGHHDALSRAWVNLLLNAAEAMGEAGGTITVKLATAADGAAVELRFLDEGPGIPPDRPDRIWEPDFTTKSRGTGLGLALVRQAVQAHGGGIWARNRPEGGAEFRVLLPLRPVTAPAPPATETPAPA